MLPKNWGLVPIIDVDEQVYKTLNLPPDEINFFRQLGASGVRMDQDFGGEVEAKISQNRLNFKVEINASAGVQTLEKILASGGKPSNLIACHNFYPLRYTGLKYERFIELSARIKQLGVPVAAFVTQEPSRRAIGPWGVNQGMPTLEEHRDWPLVQQVAHLLSIGLSDQIIVSQQGLTSQEFKMLGQLVQNWNKLSAQKVVNVEIEWVSKVSDLEKEIVLARKLPAKLAQPEFKSYAHSFGAYHLNRPDYSSYFIRSTLTRVLYKSESIKPARTGKMLQPGDVVVLNDNIGRYKGEVHILLRPIDDRRSKIRNLVGRVIVDDLYQLQAIVGGRKFKIYAKN
ncbi:MupG family TIM beta-alpha barrel fold protein [Mycoplasma sp. ATU-Cv-508]|uniref:MupG family TIM beta-alpha barrel fold protein n=1 Tax=Mycoplasma sp. ATU-Cv-508 TaxID=2048001 RepID=UPI0013751658